MTTIRPVDMGINHSTINGILIQSISWVKFKGKAIKGTEYFAHIYWNITYECFFAEPDSFVPSVVAKPFICPKSWVIEELVSEKLLRHEYGHYLIGCLCALQFQQKINSLKDRIFKSRDEATKFCQNEFKETLRQYLQLQRVYDCQTEHYQNEQAQEIWERFIAQQLNNLIQNGDREKHKNSANIKKKMQKKHH